MKKVPIFLRETWYESDIEKCVDLKSEEKMKRKNYSFYVLRKVQKNQVDGVGIGVNFVAF